MLWVMDWHLVLGGVVTIFIVLCSKTGILTQAVVGHMVCEDFYRLDSQRVVNSYLYTLF